MTKSELIEKLTRRYREDVASQRKAVAREDIPISYELITPEWLTGVLCDAYPGANVVAFRLGEPDSGTTARRRIFMEYNAAGRDAGLPKSTFAKSSQELIHRISYALNGSTPKEANFYNFVRPKLSVEVVRSFFANYDPVSCNSIVLLEDLQGYASFCDEHTSFDRDQAVDMTCLLADMHAAFSAPDALASITPYFNGWAEQWVFVTNNGMEEYSNKGFLAAREVIPPRLFARYPQVWPRTLDSVRRQEGLPRTFNHGDTHLANWYRTTSGRMGISDWQGAVIGHWSRDLVYALSTALTIEQRRAWEKDLIDVYIGRSRANGVAMPSFDEAFTCYRQQSLSALAYWTVTYTPSPGMPQDMQPKDRALEFVKRLTHAVDDLEALDSF